MRTTMNMIPTQSSRTPEADRVIAERAFQSSLLALHAAIQAASADQEPDVDSPECIPVRVRPRQSAA